MTDTTERARIEPGTKWVRGYSKGRKVVDTRVVQLVWTHPYYPTWFFPVADVDEAFAAGATAATEIHDDLPDHVSIRWDAIDHWFEEDVEVFVHPRDPYSRIDALASSRHVRVSIDGTVVADTHKPTILFETGLLARYYLPPTDVRLDLLTPTDTTTGCPYKGVASYWTATIEGTEHPDIVWSYPTPLPESEPVAGLMCFYNEKVDIEIDGVAQERAQTHFG